MLVCSGYVVQSSTAREAMICQLKLSILFINLVNGIVCMNLYSFSSLRTILTALTTLCMQCMPGDPHKVLVTSNDSRVRVYDGLDLIAKYKGTLRLSSFGSHL
jgi:hypothetical protein